MKKIITLTVLSLSSFGLFMGAGLLMQGNPDQGKQLTNISHVCKWELCPYKNITPLNWNSAVVDYVEDEGTDAWCIDMLHLEFPNDEYEQLEDKLFNWGGEPITHFTEK